MTNIYQISFVEITDEKKKRIGDEIGINEENSGYEREWRIF
jgi:hypothetical protein